MDLTSRLYNPDFHRGALTTRPATAKKIDLDPISRRTINPEFGNENANPSKVRKALQPSNYMNEPQTTEKNMNCRNSFGIRASTPKANQESQYNDAPVKRILKSNDLKKYDYSSQIASLPFGNQERPAQNDLSMMPRSNSRPTSSQHSWMIKQMKDFRSELENLPGSYNSRIPKEDPNSIKSTHNYATRNMLTSPEMSINEKGPSRRKFPSENEKTCVKELDIRDSKVKQFDEKRRLLGESHQENPIIKHELLRGKPRDNYPNAFKSSLRLY